MKLEQIIGTIALPLEHDGLEFSVIPFSNAEVAEWNRTQVGQPADGQSEFEFGMEVQAKQLELLAKKLRRCLAKGDPKKVTTKWVGDQFPQPILQDLAVFLANGQRPAWAGEAGN